MKNAQGNFFMPFLCHNFSQIFELSIFFQNLTRKVFKKFVFYLINSKLTKSRTFESNTAPPHINNFSRTRGSKSRTNWRYPAHSGNSEFVFVSQQYDQIFFSKLAKLVLKSVKFACHTISKIGLLTTYFYKN